MLRSRVFGFRYRSSGFRGIRCRVHGIKGSDSTRVLGNGVNGASGFRLSGYGEFKSFRV